MDKTKVAILGTGSPIGIAVAEHLTRKHDVELIHVSKSDVNDLLNLSNNEFDAICELHRGITLNNIKDIPITLPTVHWANYTSGKEARRERRKLKRKKK